MLDELDAFLVENSNVENPKYTYIYIYLYHIIGLYKNRVHNVTR